MNEETKKRRLELIRELKRDKYIGTKEAYDYICDVDKFYSNLEKIPKDINERLSQFGRVTYPATPERVVGIILLDDVIDRSYEHTEDTIDSLDSVVFYSTRISGSVDNVINPEDMELNIGDLFRENQIEGMTDLRFSSNIIDRLVNERVKPFYEEYWKIYHSLDWSKLFSKKTLSLFESNARKAMYSGNIKLNKRAERMIRDRVDNRLERRRELVTDLFGREKIEEMEEISSYEEAVEYITFLQIMNSGSNKRYEEELKLILHSLKSDRNFIRRYLGERK